MMCYVPLLRESIFGYQNLQVKVSVCVGEYGVGMHTLT